MTQPIADPHCLAKLKNFAEFRTSELETLVSVSERVKYAVGDTIVKEGSPSDSMFVILSGKVAITHGDGDRAVPLAELTEGDFFGELALVDNEPRSASCTVVEDCEVLVIAQTTVGVLAGASPRAAIKLLVAVGRSLARRLRAGNRRISDLMLLGLQDCN